jgi:hypothetical protein
MISAALLALMMPALAAAENSSLYRVTGETGTVHIYPTPELSRQIKAERGLAPGVLVYHGGPVMTGVSLYAIFWIPAKLQNGNATSLSAKYQGVAKNFLSDYPDHGIANNSTQYYSTTLLHNLRDEVFRGERWFCCLLRGFEPIYRQHLH